MRLTKDVETEHEHIEPPNADLAVISGLAQREVKAEEVWCGALHSCNTKLDRAGERFTKAYLERFAETMPNKPILEGHDTTKRPLGRLYKAEVLPDGDGWFLKSYYYLKADSPLISEIELGITKDCSIGYRASRRVCDLDGKEWHPYRTGKDYCEHEPLEEYDGQTCTLTYCDTAVAKAEAMEMSFVWVGCQPGAEAIAKSFDAREVAFLKELYERLHGTPQPGTGAPKQMPTLEEVQKELLDTKAAHQSEVSKLQKEQADLKKAAEDGEWGRTYLAAEIIKMAGLLGEGDYYGQMLKMLGDKPTVGQLEPLWKMVGEKFDVKFPQVRARTDGAPDPKDSQAPTVAVPWFRQRAA